MGESTSSMVLRYCNTHRYKMVCILSGYRRLLCLTGIGFIERLRDYRASTGLKFDPITMNTMMLIDAGYTELDEKEIRLYSNYIANVLNFDEGTFYMVLRDRADKIIFYENDTERTTRQMIHAMCFIDRRMKTINSHA